MEMHHCVLFSDPSQTKEFLIKKSNPPYILVLACALRIGTTNANTFFIRRPLGMLLRNICHSKCTLDDEQTLFKSAQKKRREFIAYNAS